MNHKGKSWIGVAVATLGLAILLAAPAARADLYWTNPVSGVWDTDSLWATDTSGDGMSTWVDSSNADFYGDASGSPATITINSPVNVGNLTFDGGGYTVAGAPLNLVPPAELSPPTRTRRSTRPSAARSA